MEPATQYCGGAASPRLGMTGGCEHGGGDEKIEEREGGSEGLVSRREGSACEEDQSVLA